MKQFISLVLIFGISLFGLAQEITVTPPKEKPKTATKKVVKKKPTAKPQAKIASKAKTKPKARAKTKARSKITTIEAATKDGKPVTLRSNGTWEYVKTKPVAKETTKPVVKEVKKPVAKEIQKPVVKETKKPVVKPTPTPKPVAKTTPTPKPIVKTTPTPKPVVKSTPTPAACDLALRDSPMIRGLRLGMSRSDADRIIPGNRIKVVDSPTIIAYPKYGNAGFENVYSITAQFYDDALSELVIEYDSDANKWKNAREFAQNLSANLNLPFKFWKFNARNAYVSEMQCRDFSITLDSSSNEITLQSGGSRQKTAQETGNRNEVFKP